MKCLICNGKAEYDKAENGPLCKDCWLGLKMFEFNSRKLSRARKYLVNGLKCQQKLNVLRKSARKNYSQSADAKFDRLVREELRPVDIPVQKPKTIKIIRDGELFKEIHEPVMTGERGASRPTGRTPF